MAEHGGSWIPPAVLTVKENLSFFLGVDNHGATKHGQPKHYEIEFIQ